VRFIFRKIGNVLRFLQSNIYVVEKFFSIKWIFLNLKEQNQQKPTRKSNN
jgi:hypothetical protein